MKAIQFRPLRAALVTLVLIVTAIAVTSAQAMPIRAGFNANTLARNDDLSTGMVNFGFTVNFFGNNRSGGFVNNNGNVTLDSSLSTFTPFNLATTNREILAPFFGDVDTRRAGNPVTYGTGSVGGQLAFGANWLDVDYFNSSTAHTNRNSFQLVLVDRSDITAGDFDFEFNISQVQWETGTASGGNSQGLGGNCARVGWSNGGTSTFELAGSAVCGAFLDGTGTSAVVGANALPFNELNSALAIDANMQSLNGRYLFQVRNGSIVDPSIPEPGTVLLLGMGIAALGLRRRNKSA